MIPSFSQRKGIQGFRRSSSVAVLVSCTLWVTSSVLLRHHQLGLLWGSRFWQGSKGCLGNVWTLLGFRLDGKPRVLTSWELIFEGLGALKCPSPHVYKMQVWSGPERGGRHKVGGPQHMSSRCLLSDTDVSWVTTTCWAQGSVYFVYGLSVLHIKAYLKIEDKLMKGCQLKK